MTIMQIAILAVLLLLNRVTKSAVAHDNDKSQTYLSSDSTVGSTSGSDTSYVSNSDATFPSNSYVSAASVLVRGISSDNTE